MNVKRPYGDMTCFETDMAEILGIEPEGADGLSQAQCDALSAMHESLEGVLQVWLREAELESGDYAQEEDGSWRGTEQEPGELVLLELTRPPPPGELVERVKRRDLAAARRLLERSADPAWRDAEGHSAIGYAIRNRDLEAVELLVGAGVAVNEPSGRAGYTPLMQAAIAGSAGIFAFLLGRGGDARLRSPFGTSILGLSVLHANAEVEGMILAGGWSEGGSLGAVGFAAGDPKAASLLASAGSGAPVARVVINSAADRMGLQAEDIVVGFNGSAVPCFEGLVAMLASTSAGDEARIAYLRKGERREASGRLSPRIGEPLYKQ